VATVALLVPAAVSGQERVLPPPAVVLVGGGVSHDVPNAEAVSGALFGLRLDLPLSDFITLEPGMERASWTTDGEDQIRWVLDLGVRGEYQLDRFAPYLGGNIGVMVDFDQEREPTEDFIEPIFGGHGGVRMDLTDRIGVRGEVRGRWFDRFESTWILYTGGVSWRF
jgi:hypothetical protein